MAWDREKRGIFQRKQEKPQIKKHKPLDSEGNDGDLSIRQLKDGVFLFFKALGRWYKTLNTSSQVIPEPDAPRSLKLGSPAQPVETMYVSENSLHIGNTKSEQGKISLSSDKTDLVFKNKAGTESKVVGKRADSNASNVDNEITLGDESGGATTGVLNLGAGSAFLGGFISGCANYTNQTQSAYLGVRFLADSQGSGDTSVRGISVVDSPGITSSKVYLATHDNAGGHIGIHEHSTAPSAVADMGILYAKTDGLYYLTDGISAVNLLTGLSYLPLGGGALTGDITITDSTAPQLTLINTSGEQASFSVSASGDLNIATAGAGDKNSDITLDADGAVYLDSATKLIRFKADGTNFGQFNLGDAVADTFQFIGGINKHLYFKVLGSGNTTFANVSGDISLEVSSGDISLSSTNISLDASANITLDSATGAFIIKGPGSVPEFSVANSAYAGMILGYTAEGINQTPADYNTTTSEALVASGTHHVSFIAPPSTAVEIEVQINYDVGGSTTLSLGLSNHTTIGNNSLAVYLFQKVFEGKLGVDNVDIIHKWVVTGLTAGTSYKWYLTAASNATTSTPHLQWGGDSTNEDSVFIMKATALPTAVADYAIYS